MLTSTSMAFVKFVSFVVVSQIPPAAAIRSFCFLKATGNNRFPDGLYNHKLHE